MRIAFLGGTRFIGAAAVRACVARGHDVEVWHRGVHVNETGARGRTVDRRDAESIRRAVESTSPDVLVDTHAMTRRDAETVLDALAGSSVAATVVLSSQDVYAQLECLNGHPPPPSILDVLDESAPLGPEYPFRHLEAPDRDPDYDKQHVERAYAAACLSGAIGAATALRLPPTYGIGDPRRRFGALVDALDEGKRRLPRRAGGTWRWTHAHVDDVAHAIALACERHRETPGYDVFDVGEATTPTMSERAEQIAHAMGVDLGWDEDPEDHPPRFSHLGIVPNDVVTTSAKIRDALGFSEVTGEDERVASIVAWARRTSG